MFGPKDWHSSSLSEGSITIKNNVGERTEPWSTPRLGTYGSENLPLTLIMHLGSEYHEFNNLQVFPFMPQL